MRRLLIVSPCFPPTDAVDMHRVRMNVRHYPRFGWEPIVLAVNPPETGVLTEPNLSLTLPDGLEIHRTGAWPLALTRRLGVSALGLRAHTGLEHEGARLIAEAKPDLCFFSTTCFPVMTLGPRWKRRFGLPYVLDMQDPWHTLPRNARPPQQTGAKARVMQALHQRMERVAMARADGLIAVSGDYITALRESFPNLRSVPAQTIPFGHEPHDLDVARERGRPVTFSFAAGPGVTCLYAGRAASDMLPIFRGLFEVLAAGVEQGLPQLGRLRLAFLGTGYGLDNPLAVTPVAQQVGIAARMIEYPNRVSLLDAKRTTEAADLLLVAGSNDLAYQPSKLFQSLATDQPILCVGPRAGPLAGLAGKEDSVLFLATEDAPAQSALTLETWLQKIADGRVSPGDQRKARTVEFSAHNLARRECLLFDEALRVFQA